jgi:hypothetical protein
MQREVHCRCLTGSCDSADRTAMNRASGTEPWAGAARRSGRSCANTRDRVSNPRPVGRCGCVQVSSAIFAGAGTCWESPERGGVPVVPGEREDERGRRLGTRVTVPVGATGVFRPCGARAIHTTLIAVVWVDATGRAIGRISHTNRSICVRTVQAAPAIVPVSRANACACLRSSDLCLNCGLSRARPFRIRHHEVLPRVRRPRTARAETWW